MEVKFIGICFIFFLHCFTEVIGGKKLIVILIDGVRWDYISDSSLKGFRQIIDSGVKAPYVIPIFPSLSYPNWQSLVTGLYPENHGFVGNHFYDKATDSFFEMIPAAGAADPHWWNDAEPIWITAEKNNKKSALYWWAGCEVEIKGAHPTICERQYYDGPPIKEVNTDFQERIDDFIEMFKYSKRFKDDRLSLVLMYYSSVDFNGHYNGPKSSDVKKALQDVDEILYKMQQKIKEAHLQYDVNIMVVSDHGMTDTRPNVVRHIDLKKYASMIKHQMDYGGISAIIPQPGMLNKLVQEIAADKMEGLRLYKKDDLPEKYHLKGSSKTAPLILIAKKGYYIDLLGDPQKVSNGDKFVGHHGYDPHEVEDMRTIFLATGPDFKKGITTEVLNITDIYNVMCTILNIPALPNNGSWDRAKSMLVDRENNFPIVDGGASFTANSYCFLCVMLVTTCILMYSGIILGL